MPGAPAPAAVVEAATESHLIWPGRTMLPADRRAAGRLRAALEEGTPGTSGFWARGLMDGKPGALFARAGHAVVFSSARSTKKLCAELAYRFERFGSPD